MISNGPIPNGGSSTDGPGAPKGTVPGAGQHQPPPPPPHPPLPHSVIVQDTLEELLALGTGSALYCLEEILGVHKIWKWFWRARQSHGLCKEFPCKGSFYDCGVPALKISTLNPGFSSLSFGGSQHFEAWAELPQITQGWALQGHYPFYKTLEATWKKSLIFCWDWKGLIKNGKMRLKWDQKWNQKWDQKWNQNGIKIESKVGSKWDQKWEKSEIEMGSKMGSKWDRKWDENGIKMGSKMAAFSTSCPFPRSAPAPGGGRI